MKRIMLISVLFIAASIAYAQSECSKSDGLFKKNNPYAPKEVYKLGASPEFPYLRDLSTSEQVAAAMKRHAGKAAELNDMLMDIGFANGAKDITASAITEDKLPSGTMGNMGDGNHNISFVKLMNDGDGTKAWKVASPSGCYVYVLSACGNAFYPANPAKKTACVNVPVNLNNGSKDVTLQAAGTKTTTEQTYVYYHKRHRKHPLAPEYADLTDPTASTPILLSTKKDVEAVPQSYKVTISTPNNNVVACEDKPIDITANINVEKTGEYTGYYPNTSKKQYKEISKRAYKRIARKMRRAERLEKKVARLSKQNVETEVASAD